MTDTASRLKATSELDQVVIRFAGDSGDGMQLTGDRFTTRALFGNDLSTLPDYPAEIRAPAGTLAGVSAFQVQISDHLVLTPGDAPTVLVAMNPAALKTNLKDLAAAPSSSTPTRSTSATWPRPATPRIPSTDGSLSGFTVYEVPMTTMTMAAVKPTGAKPRDAERSKNFFALGLVSWMYTRPTEPTLEWIQQRFGKNTLVADANTLAFKAGCNFGETAELFDQLRGQAGRPRPGPVHQRVGQHGAVVGSGGGGRARPAAALPRQLPDHAGVRHPPRAVQAQELRRPHPAGRRRDRRRRRRPWRGLRRIPRGHHDQRSGHRPEVGDDRPGHQHGATAADHRHPARRSLHRSADQDRAGRPAARHVRPARRVAGADRGPVHARRLLLHGHRGGPPRPQVPHPGVPPLRRLPGQRGRAVEVPRPGSLPDISVPFANEHNHIDEEGNTEFWPYLRDPETLARPWAIPGTPDLMHRIGGLEKADGSGTSPTTRPTTST